MGRRINITESERGNIQKMYGINSYIFEDYMTIDGRFLIWNDYLFDLKEQKELGYVFTIDNLKYIFENFKFTNTPLINEVKDILNNEKISISEIKLGIILEKQNLLTEQEQSLPGEGDFQSSGTNGTSKVFGTILKIARKIKHLLWTIGGMALDAFLVASGIGKAVQWIPWAIALSLDVYQWSSGNYGNDTEFAEASTFWKGLTIGFEVLGLVTTGPVAKAAKTILKPLELLKTEKEIAQVVAKNSKMKNVLQKIYNALGGATEKLKKGSEIVKTKMPTLGKWIEGIISKAAGFITWLAEMLGRILSIPGKVAQKAGEVIQGGKMAGKNIGKGLKSATNVGLTMTGLQTIPSAIKSNRQNNQLRSITQNTQITPDFSNIDV